MTKRGRNTLSPLSNWNILLNLCLLCPYLTIWSLRRTQRLCGGESSFAPTLASNMMYWERRLKDLCEGKATFSPIYLKDKVVAFTSRSVPRNVTDKMSPARFPMPSATVRLKEPREGAPRTLGRQKVPHDLRLRKYLLIYGPSKFAAQARSA